MPPYSAFFGIVGCLLGFGFFLLWFDEKKIAAWRRREEKSKSEDH